MATTTNLGVEIPDVGADEDTWGGINNNAHIAWDAVFKADGTGTSVGLKVGTGKTLNLAAATLTLPETTFTPALAFGGSSLGITYGAQEGSYTKIGNRVFFELTIVLTNKGSATGAATIEGLPFTPGSGSRSALVFIPDGVDVNIAGGYYGVAARTQTGVAAIDLLAVGDNQAAAALTNAAFSNTSEIYISGSYLV